MDVFSPSPPAPSCFSALVELMAPRPELNWQYVYLGGIFAKAVISFEESAVAVRGGFQLRFDSSMDVATLLCEAGSSFEESAVAVRGGSQLRLNASIEVVTPFFNRHHSPPWPFGAGVNSEFPRRPPYENCVLGFTERKASPLAAPFHLSGFEVEKKIVATRAGAQKPVSGPQAGPGVQRTLSTASHELRVRV